MNEALKNRFVSFSIPYLAGVSLREIIQNVFPHAAHNLVDTIMNINDV